MKDFKPCHKFTGELIKTSRENKSITKVEAVKRMRVKVSEETFSLIETGRRGIPLKYVNSFSEGFNLDRSVILDAMIRDYSESIYEQVDKAETKHLDLLSNKPEGMK
jgi:hypothetical protein